MGSVWAGRHTTLNRTVAIKFIHPHLASSADALHRFENEAKAAAKIKSRHAVLVFDHGVTDSGQPFIVMEYLEGESLEQKLRRVGRLPLDELALIVQQAAEALAAAHEQGIVHRDLKPDNVFLAREREASRFGYVVKLVDFGIAKIVEDDAATGAGATQAGVVLGTPHYMSPEALTAAGPVTRASDLWSLGACVFTAAVGRVPFDGDAIGDVVLKVCAAPMPVPSKLVPELPRAFDEWFKKACSRAVSERFASAGEAAAAFADLTGWDQRRRELSAYELKRAANAEIADDFGGSGTSQRGLLLAGGLAGASLMLAVLGYYVLSRTRAADAEAAAAAASARAIIEAENERRLREADSAFWARQGDGGKGGEEPGNTARETRKPAPR
jgi:serine/threonine protein kinase